MQRQSTYVKYPESSGLAMDLEIYRSQARYYAAAFNWSVAHQVERIASLSGLSKGRGVLEPMCGSAALESVRRGGLPYVGRRPFSSADRTRTNRLFRRRLGWRMAGRRREGFLPRPGLRFGSVSRQ